MTSTPFHLATPIDPRDRAGRVFAQLNRPDLSRTAQVWASDAVDDFVAVNVYRARAAIVRLFTDFFAAFPDIRITVEQSIAFNALTRVRGGLGR